MISNNDTNWNLSFHPPNPCLLLLPRSLMLPPPPTKQTGRGITISMYIMWNQLGLCVSSTEQYQK